MRSRLEPLRIRTTLAGDSTILFLVGELDPTTSPILEAEVNRLIEFGCNVIVLDLEQLSFIDSSGLRVVIVAARRLHAIGGTLSIQSPSDTARRLLDITRLADIVDVVD